MNIHEIRLEKTNLNVYFDETIFPCFKNDLLDCAEDNFAPDVILDRIEDLPNKQFSTVKDVIRNFYI